GGGKIPARGGGGVQWNGRFGGDFLDVPSRSGEPAGIIEWHAGGRSADATGEAGPAGADGGHGAGLAGFEVHGPCRGIFCPVVAGDRRNDVPGQLRESADDLYLARTDQPLALRSDGVQQAKSQVGGGGAEIFPVRRHGGGLHVVWIEPALRSVGLDRTEADRRGAERKGTRPVAGGGDC